MTITTTLDELETRLINFDKELDDWEALCDQIDSTIASISAAVSLTDSTEKAAESITLLIDTKLQPVSQLIANAAEAIHRISLSPVVLDQTQDTIAQLHDATADLVNQSVASVDEWLTDIREKMAQATDDINERVTNWISTSEEAAEAVNERVAELVEHVETTTPDTDAELELLIAKNLLSKMDELASVAEAHLDVVEAAMDQAGGALFDGIGSITQKVGAVQDVLEAVKPITDAYEALG